MICSDNSSLAAIAMQDNVLFSQRSVCKTIDLKTLLTLRTRAQSSGILVEKGKQTEMKFIFETIRKNKNSPMIELIT